MKKEKIRRYKKTELLELLIRLRTENDELRAELDECRKQLEDKSITIENAGSIAEAAVELSGVFQAAEAACRQYMENIEANSGEQARICAKMEAQCAEKCARMEAETEEKCRAMLAEAEQGKAPVQQPDSGEDFQQLLERFSDLMGREG